MPKDGSKTKVKILDETTRLVFENGFAGTTIDHILERTGITKGAFFYHFKSKSDLANSLMEYFAKADMDLLMSSSEEIRSKGLRAKDQLIAFIQYFIDLFAELDAPYPGCLYASYLNEPEQFPSTVHEIVASSILKWRSALIDLIEATMKTSPPQINFDINSLADQFTVVMEGAFVLSKALNDPKLTANQLIHYRNYVKLLFAE